MKKIISVLFLISMMTPNYAIDRTCKGFNKANIQRTIEEYDGKFIPPNGDFKLFEKQVAGYGELGIISIPVTENLINKYLNTFSASERDSVYILFNRIYYKVAADFNDSLETTYSALVHRTDNDIVNPEEIEFKRSLDMCGLTLLSMEGTFYVDEKYDYFYNLFKDRVSPALSAYLTIRKKELKEGFSNDAELLISFNQLYERVLTWEDFLEKYPDFFGINDAQLNYTTYLSTLLTGLDNSQPFDAQTGKLIPELNKLYLKIYYHHDSRKSTNVIKDYYELLQTSDLEMPDDLDQFLKDHELFSMKGVEPEAR